MFQVGCVSNSEIESRTDEDLAIRAIENGDYDEAIRVLSIKVDQFRDTERTRVILASAYAAQAGVFVRDFMGLAQELVVSTRSVNELFVQRGVLVFEPLRRGVTDQQQLDIVKTLEQFYRALWQVSDLIYKFQLVPRVVSRERVAFIERAVVILGQDEALSPGASLYRGLLRLTLLRHKLESQKTLSELRRCQIDIATLSVELHEIYNLLREILVDVAKGALKREKSLGVWKTIDDLDRGAHEIFRVLQPLAGLNKIDARGLSQSMRGSCEG